MITLMKVRRGTTVHVTDVAPQEGAAMAVCGHVEVWDPPEPFLDRLSISCRECRSQVTRWMLGGPL